MKLAAEVVKVIEKSPIPQRLQWFNNVERCRRRVHKNSTHATLHAAGLEPLTLNPKP